MRLNDCGGLDLGGREENRRRGVGEVSGSKEKEMADGRP